MTLFSITLLFFHERNKVGKKPLKLLQHCFPASPCSPGFDKICWMLFLELTSSRFILSDEKSEGNREGRRTWNGFISPSKSPGSLATPHRVSIVHRSCSQESACHPFDEQLSSTHSGPCTTNAAAANVHAPVNCRKTEPLMRCYLIVF